MKRRTAPGSSYGRGAVRGKSTREPKVIEKLLKMADAKSQMAKYNYLVDALREAGVVDSQMDQLLHFFTEMGMGGGEAGRAP